MRENKRTNVVGAGVRMRRPVEREPGEPVLQLVLIMSLYGKNWKQFDIR